MAHAVASEHRLEQVVLMRLQCNPHTARMAALSGDTSTDMRRRCHAVTPRSALRGRHATGVTSDGLRAALDSHAHEQHNLVAARNRLARAIADAAMSGMTRERSST